MTSKKELFTATISGKRRAHDRVKKSIGRRQQTSIQEFLPAKSERELYKKKKGVQQADQSV